MKAMMHRPDGSGGKPPNLLHVVPPPSLAAADSVEVDEHATGGWMSSGEVVRAQVSAFLSGIWWRESALDVSTEKGLPEEFAVDLARGGPLLRAAFPDLRRRVIEVAQSPSLVSVRVRCEGGQTGPFFGLLSPTGRAVAFDVVHLIAAGTGHLARHQVAVDMRRIVVQLVGVPIRRG